MTLPTAEFVIQDAWAIIVFVIDSTAVFMVFCVIVEPFSPLLVRLKAEKPELAKVESATDQASLPQSVPQLKLVRE